MDRRARNLALLSQSSYGGRGRVRAADISEYLPSEKAKELELSEVESESAKKPKKDRIKEFTKSINGAYASSTVFDDGSIELTFHGARLLTYNELLHVGAYVRLTGYKKACHKAINAAFITLPLEARRNTYQQIDLTLTRSAGHKVDPDALVAMFKFLTDGLVKTGVINDDTDEYIRYIVPKQIIGDFSVSIKLTPVM